MNAVKIFVGGDPREIEAMIGAWGAENGMTAIGAQTVPFHTGQMTYVTTVVFAPIMTPAHTQTTKQT